MLDRAVPAICNGPALEDGLEKDRDSDPQDDGAGNVGCDSEVAGVENSYVEEKNGEFGRCYC